MTAFEPGELVNVHINGVRYLSVNDPEKHGVETSDGRQWSMPPTAVIERVAPKEWPPQAGDVWVDRNKARWMASGGSVSGVVALISAHDRNGHWVDPDDLSASVGPMTLVSRWGWTPDQPSTVDQPEPDERAAFIGGLLGLVDFLNAHPEVPHPDAAPCQYSVIGYMGLHSPALAEPGRLAEALRVATLIGSELNDDLTARRSFGGGVEYIVHTYRDTLVPADPEPADELKPLGRRLVIGGGVDRVAPESTDDEPVEVAGA